MSFLPRIFSFSSNQQDTKMPIQKTCQPFQPSCNNIASYPYIEPIDTFLPPPLHLSFSSAKPVRGRTYILYTSLSTLLHAKHIYGALAKRAPAATPRPPFFNRSLLRPSRVIHRVRCSVSSLSLSVHKMTRERASEPRPYVCIFSGGNCVYLLSERLVFMRASAADPLLCERAGGAARIAISTRRAVENLRARPWIRAAAVAILASVLLCCLRRCRRLSSARVVFLLVSNSAGYAVFIGFLFVYKYKNTIIKQADDYLSFFD